jgi:predicted nuclease of predicted toxin-antitoxin system
MKILVDENIPLMTVETLRKLGNDVLDIRGTPDEGSPDDELWSKSQMEGRLLITTDKGFSKHRNEPHLGILIIRLKKPNRVKIHQRVMQAINQFGENEWNGFLVVMRDVVQTVWRSKHL